MYINRALLLVVGILLVFSPVIEEWAFHSATAWYRPFQLWLVVVAAAWWNQRTRYNDEL